jgi:hypothetical protein
MVNTFNTHFPVTTVETPGMAGINSEVIKQVPLLLVKRLEIIIASFTVLPISRHIT